MVPWCLESRSCAMPRWHVMLHAALNEHSLAMGPKWIFQIFGCLALQDLAATSGMSICQNQPRYIRESKIEHLISGVQIPGSFRNFYLGNLTLIIPGMVSCIWRSEQLDPATWVTSRHPTLDPATARACIVLPFDRMTGNFLSFSMFFFPAFNDSSFLFDKKFQKLLCLFVFLDAVCSFPGWWKKKDVAVGCS